MHSIPLQAPILSIESFNVATHDGEVFERKVIEAQAHVTEKTKAIAAVGGWDVFEEMQQPTTATGATTAPTTATATGTTAATQVEGEKSNLTGEGLGEAGKGPAPVTGEGVTGAVQPGLFPSYPPLAWTFGPSDSYLAVDGNPHWLLS